jgi:hypothetical protein
MSGSSQSLNANSYLRNQLNINRVELKKLNNSLNAYRQQQQSFLKQLNPQKYPESESEAEILQPVIAEPLREEFEGGSKGGYQPPSISERRSMRPPQNAPKRWYVEKLLQTGSYDPLVLEKSKVSDLKKLYNENFPSTRSSRRAEEETPIFTGEPIKMKLKKKEEQYPSVPVEEQYKDDPTESESEFEAFA